VRSKTCSKRGRKAAGEEVVRVAGEDEGAGIRGEVGARLGEPRMTGFSARVAIKARSAGG
jgi:hypothetical protein